MATITKTPSSADAAIACGWFAQNPGRARSRE